MSIDAKATGDTPPALAPGTFTSVLPELEDILGIFYGLVVGDGAANTDDIVAKAKEVRERLAAMRKAASDLPGGHLGTDAVVELTRILEEQVADKRAILRSLHETQTPVADANSSLETTADTE